MKWFIDDNGWPQAKPVSANELQSLIHQSPTIKDMIQTEDMDLEDIFDESLLPDRQNQKREDEVSRCKVKPNLEISSLTTLSYNLETQKSISKLFSINSSSRDNEFTRKISARTETINDLSPPFSFGISILLNTGQGHPPPQTRDLAEGRPRPQRWTPPPLRQA
ncbi:hypothetical protein LINGRAHAP2_LOCUS23210, partial [Linum grandiflorum]